MEDTAAAALLLLWCIPHLPVNVKSASKGMEDRELGDEVPVLRIQGRVVQKGALFEWPRGAWGFHHRCSTRRGVLFGTTA